MVERSAISELKRTLRKEVAYLCRAADGRWNAPIVETLQNVRQLGSRAVLFGGTLRSLLVSRLFRNRPGRPRDVDIVVERATVDRLKEHFRDIVARETRFGGLSLQHRQWQFDVWPLTRTWAFEHGKKSNPSFFALPETTFLNLEAIAVDIWPASNGQRRIYASNDQFFDGVLSRTLELNYEENPFPVLSVVRSLVMAASLDFSIGPKLARYIVERGGAISEHELESTQRKHYGVVRCDGSILMSWIRYLEESTGREGQRSVQLPLARQPHLWSEDQKNTHACMRVFASR